MFPVYSVVFWKVESNKPGRSRRVGMWNGEFDWLGKPGMIRKVSVTSCLKAEHSRQKHTCFSQLGNRLSDV